MNQKYKLWYSFKKNLNKKILIQEQENSYQRKEYIRLKHLEDSYKKYLDERDWGEKITDSLNVKLDESEELARNRNLEILTLKDKISQLNNELSIMQKNKTFNSNVLDSIKNESELDEEIKLNFPITQQKIRLNSNKKLNLRKKNEKISNEYNNKTTSSNCFLPFKNSFENKETCFNESEKTLTNNTNHKDLIDDGLSPVTQVNSISDNQNGMAISIISSTRSVSSTPDDTVSLHDDGPPSSSGVSSSGILSTFTGNNDINKNKKNTILLKPTSKVELTTLRQCHQKIMTCEKRINLLVAVTQRITNGGRPNQMDILG